MLLQVSSVEMSMVVETHLTPAWNYNQNTPRGNRGNIRARGVKPHQITLMSLLTHMEEMDQWPVGIRTSNTLDESQNLSTHDDRVWGWA